MKRSKNGGLNKGEEEEEGGRKPSSPKICDLQQKSILGVGLGWVCFSSGEMGGMSLFFVCLFFFLPFFNFFCF